MAGAKSSLENCEYLRVWGSGPHSSATLNLIINYYGVFLFHIDFIKINKTDSCRLWTDCLRGNTGYGAFKLNGKTVDAHRLSYQIHKGEIPEGMFVYHTCDNRTCVNLDHLFLGTPKENWNDGFNKGRIKLLDQTHFEKLKKHPSIGAYERGCRCDECIEIKREIDRRYRLKKKNTST